MRGKEALCVVSVTRRDRDPQRIKIMRFAASPSHWRGSEPVGPEERDSDVPRSTRRDFFVAPLLVPFFHVGHLLLLDHVGSHTLGLMLVKDQLLNASDLE